MAEKVNITSPVGRIVAGSLYKGNTTDFDGKPLVVKTGANVGQPRVNYYIGLAIAKRTETHWALTEWGKQIWAVGHAAFPQAAQRPDFAWKIEDGDSAILNKRNKKPCDNEGYPGHWIIRLSSGFAPKIYRPENGQFVQETTEGFVKPGYFVQVAFSVDGNGNQNNSGVYLNTQMVAFSAYGPEINFGPDVNEAGFGAAPLPAGASLTPPASALPMPAATQGAIANLPGNNVQAPPPVAVAPNVQFLNVPGAPALPTGAAPVGGLPPSVTPAQAAMPSPVPVAQAVPVPPVPPASPSNGRQMTAKANGASYEAYIAAGWTDAAMIAQGYMSM